MNNIPTVPLRYCDWDRNRKVLRLASEFCGMPRVLNIVSHHTGKSVTFSTVTESDPLFDQDGWDGEMCVYRPATVLPGVDHLVISHQW